MSISIFPDKMAMYFSTMSPLAAKIFTDIQGVEESVKTSQNLTYNDRCSIIDKHLIYDLVHNNGSNKPHCQRSEMSLNSLDKEVHSGLSVFHNDPILDQDHVSALLLYVYPKKPDKYVYDDNSYWIDEHSVSYSCCTASQANVCKLTEFVKALPVPQTQETPSTRLSKKYKAPIKPPGTPVENNHVDEYHSDYEDSDGEDYTNFQKESSPALAIVEESRDSIPPKKTGGIIGVSVMGGCGPPPKPHSSSNQIEKDAQLEDNLPQQKQNSDLIAELQAKLKMNKSSKASSASPVVFGSGSKMQVSKPKAPPPPPPKVPETSVKLDTKEQKVKHKVCLSERKESTTSTSSDEEKKSTEKEKTEDDFIVDISSPCRIATPKTGFDFLDNW